MNSATQSYGQKILSIRRQLAQEGIQLTAGQPREEGGRFAGGRVAGGSKPIVLPNRTTANYDSSEVQAMLRGLTREERTAIDAGIDAEKKWEAGIGDRQQLVRQAKRADERIRRAIAVREAQGETIENPTFQYLNRVIAHGGSAHTIAAFPFGFGRDYCDDTNGVIASDQ